MTKDLFDSYIKKFSLGKVIVKAKLKFSASEKTLHCRAVADNKSFLSDVVLKNFDELGVEDSVVSIGDTEKFRSIISPFVDDFKISLNSDGTRVLGLGFNSDDIETYFGAADPITIPPSPKSLDNDLGTPSITVPFSDEFTKQFLKAKTALDETALFTVAMNKKDKIEFVFGYLTSNSNKIRLSPPNSVVNLKLTKGLQFPVASIAESFKMNTDMNGGNLDIYENGGGVVKLSFTSEQFDCTYFQFSNSK